MRLLPTAALCSLILLATWGCAGSAEQTAAGEPVRVSAQTSPITSETISRIEAKIERVGARAAKIRESGGDVSWIQSGMQQVDRSIKAGDAVAAESILDGLLRKLGESVESVSAQQTSPPPNGPRQPDSIQNQPGRRSCHED